jgi:hypothetical protein
MTGFIEIEVALNHKKLLPLGREKSGDELWLTVNQSCCLFSIESNTYEGFCFLPTLVNSRRVNQSWQSKKKQGSTGVN